MQLDEKEFVAKTVIKINSEMNGAYAFPVVKIWGHSRPSAFLKMWAYFIN